MSDLASFLLARVTEDEETAKAAIDQAAEERHRGTGPGVWHRAADDGWSDCRVEGDDITIFDEGGHSVEQADHIARWDPARVLAECAAKRALIEHCSTMIELPYWDGRPSKFVPGPAQDTPLLRLLAQPYTSHPLFRPEWATNAQED